VAYLLDTNIAIHARDGSEVVLDRLLRHEGGVFLSALSLAELQRGIYAPSDLSNLRRVRLEKLLLVLVVLPFDAAAALAYGNIIARIGWSRTRDLDRLIAGHALSTRSILVTANTTDFAGVPDLTIENWMIAI
jgi:tRNA(fMet)-specific endonuclease VapC